jgi:TonB-dependent SusC/RagA subfamily outer membrane receptor
MEKLIIRMILITAIPLMGGSSLFGQEKTIRGKVTTFDSIPLFGAKVRVKSTREVVLTDSFGLFTVQCQSRDKLKASATGFSSRRIRIRDQVKFVMVNLEIKPGEQNEELAAAVAVGYGYVMDRKKLQAISHLNEMDMDFSNFSNIYDIIRSRFPGVLVTGDNDIIIRGAVASETGSNTALLLVDGVETDKTSFGYIPTADIASINILKDASTAVYGIRGANGVVIVVTKRGGDH